MPILASVVCRRLQANLFSGLFVFCVTAGTLIVGSGFASAQNSILQSVPVKDSSLSNDRSPASKAPEFRAAANGVASIDDANVTSQATYTSQDQVPRVPNSLLVPQGPTEDDYTPQEQQDLRVNGLRGESVPMSDSSSSFTQSSTQSPSFSFGDGGRSSGTSAGPDLNMQSSRSTNGSSRPGFNAPMVQSAAQFEQQAQQGNQPPTGFGTSQSFGDSSRQSDQTSQSGSVRSRLNSDPFGDPASPGDSMEKRPIPTRPLTSRPTVDSQPMSSQPLRTQAVPSVRFSATPPSNATTQPNPKMQSNLAARPMSRLSPQSSNIRQTTPGNFGQYKSATSNGSAVQGAYNSPVVAQGSRVESSVRPTAFNQPENAKVDTKLAKTMMAKYLINESNPNLPGTPTELIEVVRETIAIDQRRPMVSQYWETYYDWATLVDAQEFSLWLGRLDAGPSPAQQAVLQAARLEARNAVLASEIQLGKSQSLLVQYMPNRPAGFLPLPSDIPLIVKYRTEYEKYKYFQMMPVSLRGIDQILPKQLQLIADRAKAVQVAKSAASQMAAALANRQTTLQSVMDSARQWRISERKLIGSVVTYNQAIADYALTVAQGYQTPEAVAKMLIAPKRTTPTSAQPNNQRQAQGGINRGQSTTNQQAQSLLQNQQQANGQGRFAAQSPTTAQQPGRRFNGQKQGQQANGQRQFGGGGANNNRAQERSANNGFSLTPPRQPVDQGAGGGGTPRNNMQNNQPTNASPSRGGATPANVFGPQGGPPSVQGDMQKGAFNAVPPIRPSGAGGSQFGSPPVRSAQGFGTGIR
ncbi:MAG: hypothetical protein AB8B55_04950 [Mariniblastus sp.]